MVFILFKLTYFFWGLVSLLALLFGIYIWNIIDALMHAMRPGKTCTFRFTPWLAIFPVLLFSIHVYGIIRHLDPESRILGVRPIRLITNSRDPEFGFIDREDVYPDYKPLYVYWSGDRSRIGKKIE